MPQDPQPIAVPDLIRQTAIAQGVPPELALAVAEQESSFNPTAVNPQPVAGGQHATGTFQLLPTTAAMLGIKDVNNPVENIQGGVKYLRQLMDRHQGNLQQVLAEYGGVKNDTTYVPQVMARIPKFAAAGAGQPPGAPPAPPPPMGFWDTMKNSLDPHEQGGRRNIAGGIGGLVGGIVGGVAGGAGGAVAGAPTGPGAVATGAGGAVLGARAGSVAGAGLFGAAEDLLVEQSGLGKWIGEHLPGGTVDEPVDAVAPPNASMSDRLWSAGKVGGEQALYDLGGQLIAAPFRYGARAALETGIGKRAAEVIGSRKQAAVAALRDAVDTLRGAKDASGVAGSQATRALAADDAARLAAAREAARTSVEGVRQTTADEIAQATAGKRQGVRDAVRAGQAGREAAKLSVDTDTEGAQAAYQAKLRTEAESGVPSESAAGRAVGDVMEGPARAALDEAGQAVTTAARSGPPRSLSAVQSEARRIMETEIAPPEIEFPTTPAETPTGQPTKPPMGDKLRRFLDQIDDAQLQQLIQHPAMPVLKRIINAPETVDFATLHQLESSLRRSVQGSGDRVVNSYVTDTTRHLVGLLRDTLAGRLEVGGAAHAPFEQATQHYADIVKLFTEGHAPLVKDVARYAPEKIVQALSPNDPTPAKMLVRLLTETAEAGGGAAGKQAGQEALQRVQDAWLHRNILTGPIDGLADRVASLRLHPEFVDALFHSTDYGRGILENAERLGQAFQAAGEQGASRLTQARDAARAASARATTAGETAIAQARQKAAQAIRGARTAGRASVSAEAAAGAARQEAQKQSIEAAGLRAGQAVRQAGRAVRSRAGSLGGSAAEVEERAFAKSPLNPKVAASAQSPARRQLDRALRYVLAGAGMTKLGPMGLVLGAAYRGGTHVPDADLLRYVVHSRPLTRMVINGLFHPVAKQLANTTGATALRGVGAVLKAPAPPQ